MRPLFQAFVCGISCAATPAGAAAQPRTPTEKWVVDFADHQCVASRQYASAENPLVLALKPSPMGDVMQITLLRHSTFTDDTVEAPVEIRMDDGVAIKSSVLAYNARKGPMRSFKVNLPLAVFTRMQQAKTVTISAAEMINERLSLSQMPALMNAMGTCLADLKSYWNINDSAQRKLRSRARTDVVSLFSSEDYPGVALSKGETGRVGYALLIDETGKVADCTVTSTSNVAVLDAQVCAVVTSRAKFTLAVGADGKPAKDSYVSAITWKIPS